MIQVMLDAADLQRLMEGNVIERGGHLRHAVVQICLADIGFPAMFDVLARAVTKSQFVEEQPEVDGNPAIKVDS